jgi:valyl-tRNA synthetase
MSDAPNTLPKNFDPVAIETKWRTHWESTGAFRPHRPGAEPFTIVNPPPNVTGSLHIGHALDNTLQDILIRHARLQGKDALWVVGMDHAGIATQMVVERQLNAHGQKRTDFSREDFIKKVWEWKGESGGEITQQLRRLGCSMDWKNERFTMDEGFSKAVTKVFVDLYNEGLLYRDKRLVNWDPGLKTAISDLEVETREINGKFWHFKYPLEDGSGFISVATTRPETMLADMAVAVNPSDARYTALIGKHVRLPITGRLIPIVADDHADPELGSGAVKITPGHDFNDFEVGKRAGFKAGEMLNMLDAEARVVQCGDIPDALLGLSVADARKEVVALIEAAGLLEKVEDRVIQTPYGDRSGVVIEPWLTDQWYVDAKTLAGPAIEAVRSGAIDVVPKSWEKTYFNWMENIQPWCVSRQLWWGHRIPAWYGPKLDKTASGARFSGFDVTEGRLPSINDANVFVALNQDELEAQFVAAYGADVRVQMCADWEAYRKWFVALLGDPQHPGRSGKEVPIVQDSDVLDTWFSSALWPFGTLGWPDAENPPRSRGGGGEADGGGDETSTPLSSSAAASLPLHREGAVPLPVNGEDLLTRHYPGDVLISGFDILFFWDARMIMQGLHFMKDAPFKTLYLHGLVRAADGSKMSKSKGNTVDPLILMDEYGTDALRFFMAAMESQGRDIKMDESRVAGYRNFATKLWNAARFCQANGIGASASVAAPKAELAVNRWIIGEVVETLSKLNKAFDEFRFDGMADCIYHFAWGTFCDWYLELIKVQMDEETKSVAAWAFDQILVMLHPFMPFITEELWEAMGNRSGNMIIHAKWPEPAIAVDTDAQGEVNWVISVIDAIRSARADNQIPPAAKLKLTVADASAETEKRIALHSAAISKIARVESWAVGGAAEGIQVIVGEATYTLAYESAIDPAVERERITKAIEAVSKEAASLSGRLNNPAFIEKAKPEAVEKARADLAEKSAEVERLRAAMVRLG